MKKMFIWVIAIAWGVLIWRLTTTPQLAVTDQPWLQSILMMGAHFSFFGIQAILLYFALDSNLSTLQSSLSGVIGTSIFGAMVEFRQLSIPGRTADPMDWILDTLGAIVFLAILKTLKDLHYWSKGI